MTKVYELAYWECDKCKARAFYSSLLSEAGWAMVERYQLHFCKECLERNTLRELIDEHMTEELL